MSLRNLTKPSTFRSPEDQQRVVGQASRPTSAIRSKFKHAGPRDRIALSFRNVPGLPNRKDDFEVRAWKDASVGGGVAVQINCHTLSIVDWRGAPGKAAIREYVAANAAEAASLDDATVGRKVMEVLRLHKHSPAATRNAALAQVADSLGLVDEQLVTHLFTVVTQATYTVGALLATLPATVPPLAPVSNTPGRAAGSSTRR